MDNNQSQTNSSAGCNEEIQIIMPGEIQRMPFRSNLTLKAKPSCQEHAYAPVASRPGPYAFTEDTSTIRDGFTWALNGAPGISSSPKVILIV